MSKNPSIPPPRNQVPYYNYFNFTGPTSMYIANFGTPGRYAIDVNFHQQQPNAEVSKITGNGFPQQGDGQGQAGADGAPPSGYFSIQIPQTPSQK